MNKYDLVRSKFLILIAFLITFTLLYLFTYVKSLEILEINSNDYLTGGSKEYSVAIKNEEELKAVKEAIKEMNTVHINKSDNFTLYYFNEKGEYKPRIKWLTEVNGEESYNIVLGKELYKEYLEKNQESYELITKDSTFLCQVVGILENNKLDFKDFSKYVLIDLESTNIADFNGIYKVEGDSGTFIKALQDASIEFKENDLLLLTLSGGRFFSIQGIFAMVIILLFIFAMILIVKLWFTLYMKEIGIKIAFGGGRYKLLADILRKYLLSIGIGILASLLAFYIYYSIFLTGVNIRSLLLPFILSLAVVFGLSLIAALINYILFSKKSIREIIEL